MSLNRAARSVCRVTTRMLAGYLALSLAFGGSVGLTTADVPSRDTTAYRPGQTSTPLPGGGRLLVGGEGPRGVVATVTIAHDGGITPLPTGLLHARAWHTATMLPDGRILIHGGLGSNGRVVLQSEIFDPSTRTFAHVATGLSPRAHHTATLLTEGQIVIIGGISAGSDVLPTAEMWDPNTGAITVIEDHLNRGRGRHSATLLGDGRVLIAGGVDPHGSIVQDTEMFDPVARSFSSEFPSPDDTSDPATLMETMPSEGATDVPHDVVIVLRFSGPLRTEAITSREVTLWGREGPHAATIVPAEAGRLVFVTPSGALLPESAYALTLHDVIDSRGTSLPAVTIQFTTAKRAGTEATPTPSDGPGGRQSRPSGPGPSDDEDWVPTPQDFKSGGWRTGRSDVPEIRSLPPLQAAPGTTALSGQVLRLNGKPLQDVTLRIGTASTRTDATGRFLLTGVSPGVHELVIEGSSANAPGRSYGRFAANVDIKPGQTEVLPYTIWMTKLDTVHAIRIADTTSEVVITTPRIPGLELRIPAGARIRDEQGRPVTELTITPIPVDRPPFPLPEEVEVPRYFTIQPHGAQISSPDGHGARLVFPNWYDKAPGDKVPFWDYDAKRNGWYVFGFGTVTDDGRQVRPDPGTEIFEFRATLDPEEEAPPTGPPAGTTGRGSTQVDLATGLFVYQKTDVYLRDILPIALTRTYRPQDTVSRAFGIGATHPYEMFVTGNAFPYTWRDLVLPDGGRVHFERISAGTGYADAVFEHTTSPSAFYKSQISWNGAGWDLRLKNGTVYVFSNGVGSPLMAIRDRNGNALGLTRVSGTSGRVMRITTPHGRWAEFMYDASNRVIQIKDVIGRVITYGYDGSGRLASVTDAAGGVTQYTYDASHRMLTLRDPRAIVFLTNEFNADSRVTRQTRADGTTYQFAYTIDGGTGKIVQADVTNPRNYVRRVAFTATGYVASSTAALGTPIQQTTSYERQAVTNLITAMVDALGRRLEHTYDAMGNILTTTRLAGTPDAATTTFTYEPIFNQVLTATNPLGHTTDFGYDSRGNVLTVQDPLDNITTLTHNTAGQVLTKRLPGDPTPTTYTYQFADLVTITDPLGNEKRRFVDALGRTVSERDPLGRQRHYAWDALDRLVSFTDPLAGVATMSYDGNDNLLSLTDPPRLIGGATASGVTAWTPDTLDRLDTRADPLGRTDRSTYDPAGNMATFTDRKGQVTSLTYDALNRPTQATYHDGSTTTYTWDAGNRLTQVVDSLSGTITRTYNGLDRLSQELTPQGGVSYTHDRAGRRTGMTVAGQPAVAYSYDNANRLTQITQSSSVVTFEYDAAGRRTRLTLPNGVSTEYAYDVASRLTGLTYKRGTTVLGTLAYAYDAAGKRTQTTGSWARTGLPPAMGSATYNAANQQLTVEASPLTYDLNGSLIAHADTTYTWDARSRLVAIAGPGLTATFEYDPFGRRTQKTINGATTTYLHDGWTPVQEQTGAMTATLLTGLGIDDYLTRTDSAGRRSILTDALGSTIALTDDAGVVVTEYTYEPFGTTSVTGASSGNPFQYTGREHDGPTGLYYYRTRYYSPILHRFISEDRLEINPWETNLYAYVGNDPVSFIDPYGEAAALPLAGALQLAVAALGGLLLYLICLVLCPLMATPPGSDESGAPPAPGPPPGADGAGKDGGAGGGPEAGAGAPKAPDPGIPWPGSDPAKAPPGYEWKGRPGSQPGGKEGNYHNPRTGESLRPDLDHPAPVKPHWDYRDTSGNWWRWNPDGTFDPK
jgi:RHS repeat-associated protein